METKIPAVIEPKQAAAATTEPTIPMTHPCDFLLTEFENSVMTERYAKPEPAAVGMTASHAANSALKEAINKPQPSNIDEYKNIFSIEKNFPKTRITTIRTML